MNQPNVKHVELEKVRNTSSKPFHHGLFATVQIILTEIILRYIESLSLDFIQNHSLNVDLE